MSVVSSPRALRPDEVRRKHFTVRFRGLDPNEVRGFLNALADDLARLYEEVTTLTEDNGRLRDELQRGPGRAAASSGRTAASSGRPAGTGHRPGRSPAQPGPAARRRLDRRRDAVCS